MNKDVLKTIYQKKIVFCNIKQDKYLHTFKLEKKRSKLYRQNGC